jgi:hypothetical protein
MEPPSQSCYSEIRRGKMYLDVSLENRAICGESLKHRALYRRKRLTQSFLCEQIVFQQALAAKLMPSMLLGLSVSFVQSMTQKAHIGLHF